MVEFETKNVKEITFGNNKFLEIALKSAKSDTGETDFISISKGFITSNGDKRFKNALGFPAEKELVDKLVSALQEIL